MPATAASDATRRAILDAALEAFAERGFAAATIDDVRRRSGASTGSIYHHFGDKEGIAAALYLKGLREYQSGARAELARSRSGERGIKAFIRHHLRWVGANPELARFLFDRGETEVAERVADEVAAMNREALAELKRWIEERTAAGEVRPIPADVLLSQLLGPVQGFARQWLHGRARSPIAVAERELATAAWNAIRSRGEDDESR